MTNAVKNLKPPTSFSQQVTLLKQRGLVITDEVEAKCFLEKVNYYRFSAYLLPYRSGEYYRTGVSFPTIKRLYEFDRRLRGLILSIFKPLEVMLRTTIAYHHSHTHGANGYYSPEAFAKVSYHERFLIEFERAVRWTTPPMGGS
jgi:abortive infection bacteriophage resistance protein